MGAHILVVEDEVDLADLVAFNLREGGHEVAVAHNGANALAEVARQRPDLVLLDVMLPDISGFEVCRRLRRSAETARIPVIMLTAKAEEIDRIVGFEVGADDYVIKPFSPRELTLRVEAIPRGLRFSRSASFESTFRRTGSTSKAKRSRSPRSSSACCSTWRRGRDAFSRAMHCSSGYGAMRPASRRAPSTPTSSGCGKNWAKGPAISRPSVA
jgi:DNA-binding response OmpR family regulator